MLSIDLNCDMGESFGIYKVGDDEKVLDYISSANIACGFHAGDPSVMNKTVSLALSKGVAVGAHIGFMDLVGFGRRNMNISPKEAFEITIYQIGALYGFIKAEGGNLSHVKPHGALYNLAAKDKNLALAIAEAVYKIDNELILYGLSGSELIKAGEEVGLRVANEVFADRTYSDDGCLTPRTHKDALIKEGTIAVQQVIKMIKEGIVISTNGNQVNIKAETLCIHGDGSHALEFVKKVRKEIELNGIEVSAMRT
ncbi:MAG: 5-oxoprolinase subunit PxpA [Bacillota bacterium]|nr:5-oxoprolinase subunit PxpA [Bacillota bacterium]